MYTPTEPANALPRIINRLFITSLVLIGVTAAFSLSYPVGWVPFFGLIPWAIMLGTVINHFVLWHLAKKELASRVKLAGGQAKEVSSSCTSSPTMTSSIPTPIGRYPMCLINLLNIIWTCLAALLMLGFMWMPIYLGSLSLYLSSQQGDYGNYRFFQTPAILHGIFGYAECGVLFALFGVYVRERRRFLRKQAETEKAMKV